MSASPTLLHAAFSLGSINVTWLELVAALLGLAMVGCNIRVIHWGWPLAALSAALYLLLFWHGALYGQAMLQGVFVLVSLWGWRQWLRSARDGTAHGTQSTEAMGGTAGTAGIGTLDARARLQVAGVCVVLWAALGLLLRATDSTAPWADGFTTALSLVAQVLLARKRIENWAVWAVVNIVSVGLFVQQGLWPTALLYLVFAALSLAGWRAWQHHPQAHPTPPETHDAHRLAGR